MQKKRSYYTFWIFVSGLPVIFASSAFAAVSIATATNNLMLPVSLFTGAIYNICYIVAMALFVATIAQYRAYRLSPSQTPLNRPIVLLFLTVAVALTPIIAKLSVAEACTHL